MNFLDIQNEVITNRFNTNQLPQAKNWINYRYARLWALEEWPFKYQITDLAVSGGASSVAKGTIGDIVRLVDTSVAPSYSPLTAIRAEDIWDYTNTTQTGAPYDYTVVGNTIYFERPMNANRTFKVLSTIPFTALSADTDIPLIPTEFHYLLVVGATAMGMVRENDPAYQSYEQQWNDGIQDLRAGYLTNLRPAYDSYPAWPYWY